MLVQLSVRPKQSGFTGRLMSSNRIRSTHIAVAGTERERPRADLKRPCRAVTRRARLDGLRIHDLRHSFARVGAEGGIGASLSVANFLGTLTQRPQRYARLDNDPLRRASNAIGKAIADAMDGNVVPDRSVEND